MPDLSWAEILLRVSLAGALGAAIGIERELRDREAGLRTHLLVAVGSALFTLVSAYGFRDFDYGAGTGFTLDPTRIAAQIVTGIGFLGAGAIIRQGISVRGLTTAATLWIVAAIGLASGAGYYSAAVITTAVVLFALYPLRIFAFRVVGPLRRDEGRFAVELGPDGSAGDLLKLLEASPRPGAVVRGRARGRRPDRGRGRADAELASTAAIVDDVKQLEHVRRVEWHT